MVAELVADSVACLCADVADRADITEEVMGSSLTEWPDVLHASVLKHLGSANQIAGYLLPYSQLCRACAAAALLPELWCEIDLKAYPLLRGAQVKNVICRCRAGNIRRLSLRGLNLLDDADICALADCFGFGAHASGQLEALDLDGCTSLTAEGLISAATRFAPPLSSLGIACLNGLEDRQLARLCASCPGLTSFDLCDCEWITDITPLLVNPGTLRSMNLDGCFRLDLGPFLFDRSGTIFGALEELCVDGEEVPPKYFIRLATACPMLRQLSISFAREMNHEALQALSSCCLLEGLRIKKATQPSDEQWAAFFDSQRSSQSKRHASPDSVRVIDVESQGWRFLNFAECEFFADVAMASLVARPQSRLVDVDFSWCCQLSDAGLRTLLAVAPNLERIKLAGIKNLTAHGVAPCCNLPRLAELDCSMCDSITDAMLEFLHWLFLTPPQRPTPPDLLPADAVYNPLPPRVAEVVAALWARRSRADPRLMIKNYYAIELEDWTGTRPATSQVCAAAEPLLFGFDLGG